MKVYGNVDTKDVASFALYALFKTYDESEIPCFELYHDEQKTMPVAKKDLAGMVGKAPIQIIFSDSEGGPLWDSSYVESYGINEEYGIVAFLVRDGGAFVTAMGYTSEYYDD